MKLVDILARELKVWPEDAGHAIGQMEGGELHTYSLSAWLERLDPPYRYSMAEDRITARVTRAQWQSAVDALAAQDMHEVALGDEPGPSAEWTGEGLPPVGTVCEFQHRNAPNGQWHPTTIRYSSHAFIVYVDSIHGIEECWRTDDSCGIDFRPIRTAEQIAADEKVSAITQMLVDGGFKIDQSECVRRLYEVGYRKR